jgi:phosphoglycerate dehydrogenase-like enzyme
MRKSAKVLIVSSIEGLIPKLNEIAPKQCPTTQFEFIHTSNQQQVLKHLVEDRDVSIMLAEPFSLTRETWSSIVQAKQDSSLKWFQSSYAGLDSLFKLVSGLDVTPLKQQVTLTKMGNFGGSISEYCLQHILNCERQFVFMIDSQRAKQWNRPTRMYRPLSKLTIGVMGYGDIGTTLCSLFKQTFNTRLHVLRNEVTGTEKNVDQVFSFSDNQLDQFLQSGIDYLINIMPSTHETRGLLTLEKLQLLSKREYGVTLINVGRGDIISEQTIVTALDNQILERVVSDVFEQEPLPESSPLWSHSKVTITPHFAAVSFPEDVAQVFFENYSKYTEQSKMLYQANWEGGY